MGKFIKKTLLLVLVPLSLYALCFFVTKTIYRYKLNQYSVFILGDSRTEYLDFPNTYNRSFGGTPFFVHYEFAKQFINELSNKRVYIALNNLNFSKLYQNRLANDTLFPNWGKDVIDRTNEFYLINPFHSEIRPNYVKYQPFNIGKLPRLIKKTFNYEIPKPIITAVADTATISKSIFAHWTNTDYVLEDVVQRYYLSKLIELLVKHNSEVILLKMPDTDYYLENVSQAVKEEFIELSKRKDLRLLDLNDTLAISNKWEYFYDYGHPNKKGWSLIQDYMMRNEYENK